MWYPRARRTAKAAVRILQKMRRIVFFLYDIKVSFSRAADAKTYGAEMLA
jgi:hypothetical protein